MVLNYWVILSVMDGMSGRFLLYKDFYPKTHYILIIAGVGHSSFVTMLAILVNGANECKCILVVSTFPRVRLTSQIKSGVYGTLSIAL
jgi:hypothetical protein